MVGIVGSGKVLVWVRIAQVGKHAIVTGVHEVLGIAGCFV